MVGQFRNLVLLFLIAAASFGQTISLENQVRSRINALTPPATCSAGRLYINTLGNLYVCTSTNVWVSRGVAWGADVNANGFALNNLISAQINGTSGNDRPIFFATAGSTRWQIGANSTAESGSNVGSDFVFARFNDAGSFVDSPVTITRSTGLVTVADLTRTNAFTTALGTILMLPQNAGAGEGGEVQLIDDDGTGGWAIDNSGDNIRIFRTGTSDVIFQIDNGTGAIKMFVDGSLKTLSVGAADSGGAGFKVLRVPN